MKERLDLKNAGTRLFEEIQKNNLNDTIEETVLYGDIGSLFPEYKTEHAQNTTRVNMAWLAVYALITLGIIVTGATAFSVPETQDLAMWSSLLCMGIIVYALHGRIMHMDAESLEKNKTRRFAYVLFGFSILITASIAIGAVVATAVFFATLIFSAG